MVHSPEMQQRRKILVNVFYLKKESNMEIYEELDGSYVQLTDVPDLAVRSNN
jgi:hypothetical protein